MRKLLLAGCAMGCLLASAVKAQSPVRPVFLVDPENLMDQAEPDLAFDDAGNLWLTWLRWTSPETDQVMARAFGTGGEPGPVLLLVNTDDIPLQQAENPQIAPLPGGGILLAYTQYTEDATVQVYGQRFDKAGGRLGERSTLSPSYPASWRASALARLPDGNFMLMTEGNRCLPCSRVSYSVYGRVLAPDGSPAGRYWRVPNQPAFSEPGARSLAVDGQGNAIFVWTHAKGDFFDRNYADVHGRRFSSTGKPIGREFAVNTRSRGTQLAPSVAVDADGNFVVVWQYRTPGNTLRAIFGQRFSKTGEKIGPEFRIDSGSRITNFEPSVAMDPQGNFVVVWSSPYPPAPLCVQVLARLYRPDGQPVGAEFPMAAVSEPGGCGNSAKVAFGPRGMFAVAWRGYAGDVSYSWRAVYAARFSISPED